MILGHQNDLVTALDEGEQDGAVRPTAAKIVYPHIVKKPGYCGGKAAIILESYADLSLAQVHAALTYYYDHVEEIEAERAREEEAAVDFERRKAEVQGTAGPCRGTTRT